MTAQDVPLTDLLQGAKQFIVPVFQRDYSWGTKHCLQLWDDIIRVGSEPTAKAHFVGSVVYIAAEGSGAVISRWLLIDGQQRLTTLTILLTALRDRVDAMSQDDDVEEADDAQDTVLTPAAFNDYYLLNPHAKGHLRPKLHLRRSDHETLTKLLDGNDLPSEASPRVAENYAFFAAQLSEADIETVYRGIKKLVAVDVVLRLGEDDPQMIFESLNSTGLDLTQADLIRNFVLMRQDEQTQTQLYEDYWHPIEKDFGGRYRTDFDKFARDFLILKLKPGKQIKNEEIYVQFRTYFHRLDDSTTTADILSTLKRFAGYYVAFNFGSESNPKLQEAFARLRSLIEVASPVVMKLYECYDQTQTLSESEFIKALELIESYVFRRSVCDMQTRSLGQIFATMSSRIKEDAPLVSLEVTLHRQSKNRRYPTDAEFREALITRDIYDMRHCHYLLTRIENNSKEKVDTSNYSIEHVLPQSETLKPEWQEMLGEDWKEIQERWLHRLGNLTLTGYNSEYSDRPFAQKKSVSGGFDDSPLRLNKFIKEQDRWTPAEIESRGQALAEQAIGIWPALKVDVNAVKATELEELKAHASLHSIENIGLDAPALALFNLLRPAVMALGDDVLELCNAKSVTYRVFDFFLEVLPRKNRLLLILNLSFQECDDPHDRAWDANRWAYITNASESGEVLCDVEKPEDIEPVMYLVRQAYLAVSE